MRCLVACVASGLMLVAAACRPSDSEPAPMVDEVREPVASPDATERFELEDDPFLGGRYRCVEESEADTVLVVAVSVEGLMAERTHRFPLQTNPDDSAVILSSMALPSCQAWAADGLSKNGHGVGHNGTILLRDADETHVNVRLSVSGTGQDGKRRSVDESLRVPYDGRAEKTLAIGGRLAARFETPER